MKWLIVGAGAQGRVTLDILRSAAPSADVLFLDDSPRRAGTQVGGVAVVARDWVQANVDPEVTRVVVAIGRNDVRLRAARELARMGLHFGNAVHPSAVVLPSARLGAGVTLCPGAVVGAGAVLGDHVIVNTGALVEHDCVVADGVSLSPGVRMAGRVRIERAAFIGTGATLNARLVIGEGAVVGAGAVVTRDVPPGMLVYGVPAREVRPVEPERDWPRLL